MLSQIPPTVSSATRLIITPLTDGRRFMEFFVAWRECLFLLQNISYILRRLAMTDRCFPCGHSRGCRALSDDALYAAGMRVQTLAFD